MVPYPVIMMTLRSGLRRRSSSVRVSPSVTGMIRSTRDRKSTRLNSSHLGLSYAAFCLKKIVQGFGGDWGKAAGGRPRTGYDSRRARRARGGGGRGGGGGGGGVPQPPARPER